MVMACAPPTEPNKMRQTSHNTTISKKCNSTGTRRWRKYYEKEMGGAGEVEGLKPRHQNKTCRICCRHALFKVRGNENIPIKHQQQRREGKGSLGPFQKQNLRRLHRIWLCLLFFSLKYAVFVFVAAVIFDVLLEETVSVSMLVVVALMILFLWKVVRHDFVFFQFDFEDLESPDKSSVILWTFPEVLVFWRSPEGRACKSNIFWNLYICVFRGCKLKC